MTTRWPDDPFALLPPQDRFAPAAERQLHLLPGQVVDLYWLPCRKDRPGVPTDTRPAFRPSPAERILAEEALWRGDEVVLTPNRFPFDAAQCVLWATGPNRDPTLELLIAAFTLADRSGGTALGNSVGAAASIPRSHIHLVGSHNDSLHAVPLRELNADELPPGVASNDVVVTGLDHPYPIAAIRLEGLPAARARATHALLQQRTTPSFNLASARGVTYLWPRSTVEIPAPHFPHALGAAELWGRWCFADEEPFRRATRDDLLAALRVGGHVGRLV